MLRTRLPVLGQKLLSSGKKIGNMTTDGHYFDEEAIVSLDALYLFVCIARVIVCQQRLDQLLLVCGIQDV